MKTFIPTKEFNSGACANCGMAMGRHFGDSLDCPIEALRPFDDVKRPKHYNFGKYEVADILDDWFSQNPLLWQVGKYIARADHKENAIQDLEKAEWYLKREIARRKKTCIT